MSMNDKIANTERVESCLKFYYLAISLKTKIRQGWKNWSISAERLESIAEHIYGTCMLAISIFSEFETDIDIEKVIFMIVLHETEEIIIGDLTPFDKITKEEKRKIGKKAVEDIFSKLFFGGKYIAYIEEFEEQKTKEAKFAYMCDKMECDLQAKKYSDDGNADLGNVEEKIMSSERTQGLIKSGSNTVADVFIDYDRHHYSGTVFEEFINYVQKIDTSKIV